MKKILLIFASTLLLYNSCFAQVDFEHFLSGFFPESSYYEGHHGNTDSHFLLDSITWDAWDDGYSPGGAYWKVLRHYRYDFSYLPNGDIYQIFQSEKEDNGSCEQTYRYTFEYNEQGQMTSFINEYKSYYGDWKFYRSYDFTYDEWNRIIHKRTTTGDGSENEWQYEYDDAGRITCEAYFLCGLGYYFCRFLYNYEDGELTSMCYQRYYTDTGWLNSGLYLYTYDGDRISNVLHQGWSLINSIWYNIDSETYEYDDSRNIASITTQKWDDGWVNYSRTTKNMDENGVIIQELYQVWQNNLWIDKRKCDYMLDESGNCIEGKWEDLVDDEWVDSDGNYSLLVQYNKGESILSESVNRYQAKYSYHVGIDELQSHQAEAFPNPGTNQLTIQADTPFTYVIVYDMTGHQVFSQFVSETAIRISTDSWPSGIYFWKAFNSSSTSTGKWVKN